MFVSLHLHGPVSRIEKLADLLVLFPILLLTRLGAVLDGLALDATFEHSTNVTGEAVLGHVVMEDVGVAAVCSYAQSYRNVQQIEIPWTRN